ncbi:GNAT family N-acetyltransferase [Marinobacter nanhaiticus D15-8W]|uniref:GNAT family N-acetyltransferase n=1 Tax=Marinobacter nanhaiticus D15-8W TaxID=626887 RepID=N6WW22_9GAMM|nr:GNAT family N-acetyltransferase [Marinobacter nanhaiticus]ENO15761.2 GNAT family N-acetyltransferase [Marinobacter nanhaiticus D15-8W]BES73381.1 GNAT family N-acetyltransferase [Marinobacter nanhaiticus D15-8W]
MKLNFRWSRLEDMSSLELFEIIKAREAVFVVEQQCAYQETDDMDLQSWHLSASVDGQLAAYVRVVDPGIKYEQPSIGRVMTVSKFRNLRIGRSLMDEAIRFTEEKYPSTGIKIGAQVYLRKFYESLGFEPASESYDEDGIPHIDMIRSASSAG